MAFNLLKFLQGAGNNVGQAVDNVVPGNQSYLHPSTATAKTVRPQPASTAKVSTSQGQQVLNFGGSVGVGPQAPTPLPIPQAVQSNPVVGTIQSLEANNPYLHQGALPQNRAQAIAQLRDPNNPGTKIALGLSQSGNDSGGAGKFLGGAKNLVQDVRQGAQVVASKAMQANEALGQNGFISVSAPKIEKPFNPQLPQETNLKIREAQNQIESLHQDIAVSQDSINYAKEHVASLNVPQAQKDKMLTAFVNQANAKVAQTKQELAGWNDHINQLDPSGKSAPIRTDTEGGVPTATPMPYDTKPPEPTVAQKIVGVVKPMLQDQRGYIGQPRDGVGKFSVGKQEATKLESVNPTGGVHVAYDPKARMEAKLGDNLTTLDKTAGKAPDEPVTIYRGAPSNQSKINPGDFVTTNKQLAKDYAGNGKVLESTVPHKHVLDDKSEPLGEEYIYRPDTKKSPLDYLKSERGSIDLGAPIIGPRISKPIMSSKGLSEGEAPSRFARRVAGDSRASEPLKDSMNANGYHTILHNPEMLKKADANIAASEDKALQLAKRGTSTEANATALKLLDKYLTEGKMEQADELARTISPRFTRQGQQTQILATYGRQTPTGAVRYATHQLEKAAESSSKSRQVDPIIEKLTTDLHATNKGVAEQVAKEFSAKAKTANTTKTPRAFGEKPIPKPLTPEERLAKRINVPSRRLNEPDPIKDMVNTLHKVAQQVMPEKAKAIPRDPMELIGQAVKDKGEYSRVYAAAKKLVEEKYKDNPTALEELDKYFSEEMKRTYAKNQLDKGIRNGLKGVDLGKLVREHYSTVNKAGDALKNKLMKQAGLTEEEAGQLANDIQGRFGELTKAKKESILNQMFKDKPTPTQKSVSQKIIELSNLGAFEKEDLRNLAGQKLGLPSMTAKLAGEIKNMAEHIQTLEEGPARNRAVAEMMQHIEKQIPQHLLGNIVSVWKADLLSGVGTQEGNAISNATFAGLKEASNPIATLADKVVSLKTGERTKTMTGRGFLGGAKEGTAKGIDTMKTGIDERNISADKYEQHAEINFKNPVVQKVFGTGANLVFRGMSAADQPFYYAALKNNLYDTAKAAGLTKDLHGQALRNHMEELVANPTEQMALTAKKAADKAVLAHDTILGKITPLIKSGIDRLPKEVFSDAAKESAKAGIDVIMPFTKVPSAFLMRTVDFTPLGPIKTVMSQIAHHEFNQREFVESIGEGATGTGVIAIGSALAAAGLISGGYPKNDAKEQAKWKTEKITPNSVKIGGTWISLNYLGPVGLLFGIGNNMTKAAQGGAGYAEQAVKGIAGLGQSLMGQSFLQGFSGLSDAINDPQRSAQTFLNSQASSVVPAWINNVSNATDTMQRQANNVLEAIQAKLPHFRNKLPAKIDAFGNDLTQPAGPINAAINGLKPSNDNHTPLLTELDRLGKTGKDNVVFPLAVKTIGSGTDTISLTPAQATQRQKLLGSQLTPLWNSIISSPAYGQLDDNQKATALQTALKDLNAATDRTMMAQIDSSKLTKPATGVTAQILQGHAPTADTYIAKALNAGSSTSAQSPAQKYQTRLANYNAAVKAGTLTGPKQLSEQNSLAREAITSKYSQEVQDFYGLSKAQQNDYFTQDRAKATNLYNQAKQLDTELGGTKYKYGLGTKPKKAKAAKITGGKSNFNFASRLSVKAPSSSALRSILKPSKLATSKAPKLAVYRPKTSKVTRKTA